MPGQNQQTQQQSQNTTTQPWAEAEPLLQKLVSSYNGLNTGVTAGQSDALANLTGSTGNITNFGDAGSNALTKLFDSSTAPQVGMLTDSLSKLQGNLGGAADPNNIDPMSAPGIGDALAELNKTITNNVKSVYAGSGRDPSGAGTFAGTLAKGLAAGEAPVITNQFNADRQNQQGAASTLYNAGTGTAGAITQQNQVPLANAAQALGLTPQAAQAYTQPGITQLGAANTAYQTPWTNLAALLSPATALGGMGGTSSGTGTAVTTQPQSTLSNILGGATGGIGLLSLLSDERAKDDIEEVGELHDGQPVFRYRYKGDPVTHIGLLAQKVRETDPDAVDDIGMGILAVNYKTATDRSAGMRKAA